MNYRQAKKGCMKHGSYHISKKENKETWEILKRIYPQELRKSCLSQLRKNQEIVKENNTTKEVRAVEVLR